MEINKLKKIAFPALLHGKMCSYSVNVIPTLIYQLNKHDYVPKYSLFK